MTTCALAPGTVIVMVTDGLVEGVDLPLDEGMDRTRTALAAADPADPGEMADQLLGELDPREDDVALLLRYDGVKTRPIRAGWAVAAARRRHARTPLHRTRAASVEGRRSDRRGVAGRVGTGHQRPRAHAGPVRVDLMLRGDRVRVSVSDCSPRAPAKPVIVDSDATGGRGLLLVEAMSESSARAGGRRRAGVEQARSTALRAAPRGPGARTQRRGLP